MSDNVDTEQLARDILGPFMQDRSDLSYSEMGDAAEGLIRLMSAIVRSEVRPEFLETPRQPLPRGKRRQPCFGPKSTSGPGATTGTVSPASAA